MSRWTPEQEAAILARGASVVVSAAAGSGKTSVLVERLIRLLEDPAYPAEKMVVVTFTNDAAGEVRARLNRALSQKILADPENAWLRQQQIMLQSASISTIHSFCLRLLREHFAQLDLSANFRIMEQSEADELRSQAAAEIMENLSARAAADETVRQQQKLLFDAFCGQDDTPLERLLISLHALTENEPFGQTLLAACAEKYASPEGILKEAFAMIGDALAEIEACYPPAIELAAQMEAATAETVLRTEYQAIREVTAACAQGDCAELSRKMKAVQFGTLRITAKKDGDFDTEKETVKALRNSAKKQLDKLVKTWAVPLLFAEQDISRHAELLRLLSALVAELDAAYTQRKRERNGVTFNDAMTLALSLLAERLPDGTIRRTELAEQLSAQYVCIMIDEFQDADNTQDLIFRMLSRGGSAAHYGSNLFVVGDSKQCIYRFRNANPENFYRAMQEGAAYQTPQLTENTCINLNRKIHLQIRHGRKIAVALGLAIQSYLQADQSRIPFRQGIQVKEFIQGIGSFQQTFGLIATDRLTVKQFLMSRRTVIGQQIRIGAIFRGSASGLFQRSQHLIGHVPVHSFFIGILQVNRKGNIIPRLQMDHGIRDRCMVKVALQLLSRGKINEPLIASYQMICQSSFLKTQQEQGGQENERQFLYLYHLFISSSEIMGK